MKFICALVLIFLSFNHCFGQDTIRLKKNPTIILKSWYPEFKTSPNFKVGETKVVFTLIPAFDGLSIRDNDINLITKNDSIKIVETEKTNQYLVTVNNTNLSYLVLELWFDLENTTILLLENSKWTDIKAIYPYKANRVMLQTIKLKIVK